MKDNSVTTKTAKKGSTTVSAAQPSPASPAKRLPAADTRLSLTAALDAAFGADGNPKPLHPGFQKGDPRIWHGGRPNAESKGFSAWRAFTREFGEQLAYNRKGEPIIWMGKHLTFIENILLTWCLDNRLMGLFTDVAYGKVPQTVDIDSNQPTIIHVTLGAPQPPADDDRNPDPPQIVDVESK